MRSMEDLKRTFASAWLAAVQRPDRRIGHSDAHSKKTHNAIGDGTWNHPLTYKTGSLPLAHQALASVFGPSENAWYRREIWLVDAAVLSIPRRPNGDPWGAAYEEGNWTTHALVEHENRRGLKGLLSNARKLLDYRSDVLRVVIGYPSDPDHDLASSAWHPAMASFGGDPGSMASLLVVAGCQIPHAEPLEWRFLHFPQGPSPVPLIGT